MIDIETYAEQIVVSVPSKRVAFLIDEIRDNMLSVNKKTEKMEPVLNEETGKLPVIIMKKAKQK